MHLRCVKDRMKEWIAGRNPVSEALAGGLQIDSVWLSGSTKGAFEGEIIALCKSRNIPVRKVPSQALDRIWRGNHQGVIAWCAAIEFQPLSGILPGIFERGENPLFILLDGVTDVRNAGAIARTALGAGAHAMIVGMRDVARFNHEAVKSSAGALLHLPVCRAEPLWSAVQYLRDSGVIVIGATLEGAQLPQDVDFTPPVCIVMGAEDTGISPKIMKLLNHAVRLPQSADVDSYNVSVATGMCLYEVMRQRGV